MKGRTGARFRWTTALAATATLAVAASADAYVYWTNSGSSAIGRANLDGTGVHQGFIGTESGPRGLVATGTHIYWTRPGGNRIGRANLDGGSVNHSFVVGPGVPQGVAVSSTHVYWANPGSGAIGRANADGSEPKHDFIPGASEPRGVAVTDTHVYWANSTGNSIGRANLDGTGANQAFIPGASRPLGVAVRGAHLYWTNGDTGTIGRANLDGTDANQSFITGASEPTAVAVSGTHVYWANLSTNAIGRANLDSSGVNQALIPTASGPYGVAVDVRPPSVSTEPAANVTATSATLRGAVDTWSYPGEAWFEYGRPSDGWTASSRIAITSSGFAPVETTAGDLAPNTTYRYRVVASNSYGSTVGEERTFTTAAAPGDGGGPPDAVAPRLSSFSLSPSAFIAANSGPSLVAAASVGTRVFYRLSEPATTTFTVARALPGRRSGTRCARPTRRNRKAKRCTRYAGIKGSFVHEGAAGLNGFRFMGRLRGRTLKPGKYRLTAVAKDAAGNRSKPARRPFRIRR